MIGKALTYAASRLGSRAVDSVERKIVWGGLSGIFMVAALIFGLTAVFIYLQSHYGTMQSAIALTVGCAALALVVLWMPSILNRVEDYADADGDTPAEELADAVEEDAQRAVEVAASAFMLGLNAARSLKGRA